MSLILSLLLGCTVPTEGRNPGECSDGADNDSNGDYDCDDAACKAAPACDTDADTDTDTDADTDTCPIDVCVTYGAYFPLIAGQITSAAASDPEFADYFAPLIAEGEESVSAFTTGLENFISDAYSCTTDAYFGPPMQIAHAGMGISQGEYDDFVILIANVLAADGVPQSEIDECFAPILTDPTLASSIVGQ